MSAYRYEIVDANAGVVDRFERDYANDFAALEPLCEADLGSTEDIRAFRGDEHGPFASRMAGGSVASIKPSRLL